MRDELADRYGPLPQPVTNLLEVAKLRVELRPYGITEVVLLGTQIRFAPVSLRESQVLRLQRLFPKSLVKAPLHTIMVPRPTEAPGRSGAQPLRDIPLLHWVLALVRELQPVAPPSADVASRSLRSRG